MQKLDYLLFQLDFCCPKVQNHVFLLFQLSINGEEIPYSTEGNFAVLTRRFMAGDIIEWSFDMMEIWPNKAVNNDNAITGTERAFHGVLLMGKEDGSEELSPLYHMMDSKVWRSEGYSNQILF